MIVDGIDEVRKLYSISRFVNPGRLMTRGRDPENEFPAKSNLLSVVIVNSFGGIVDVKLLDLSIRVFKLVRVVIVAGSVEVNRLLYRLMDRRLCRRPILDGIDPVKKFDSKSRFTSCFKFPIVLGIDPKKELPERTRLVRAVASPISEGIVPVLATVQDTAIPIMAPCPLHVIPVHEHTFDLGTPDESQLHSGKHDEIFDFARAQIAVLGLAGRCVGR